MAKATEQTLHSWAIYLLSGTPALFVGIIHGQPDAEAAIKAAIEAFSVPAGRHDRLIALRRD